MLLSYKATWVRANCETNGVSPADGDKFTLEELQGYVSGGIEVINLGSEHVIVANKDGQHCLPVNDIATRLYGDTVEGDVLICGKEQIDG